MKFGGPKKTQENPKKQYPLNPSNAVAPDPGFVFCLLLRIKEKKHNPGWIDRDSLILAVLKFFCSRQDAKKLAPTRRVGSAR